MIKNKICFFFLLALLKFLFQFNSNEGFIEDLSKSPKT